jgi:hypothetical protein
VSEKAKLIRGDPPKIALKRRGSPLKTKKNVYQLAGTRPKKSFKSAKNGPK